MRWVGKLGKLTYLAHSPQQNQLHNSVVRKSSTMMWPRYFHSREKATQQGFKSGETLWLSWEVVYSVLLGDHPEKVACVCSSKIRNAEFQRRQLVKRVHIWALSQTMFMCCLLFATLSLTAMMKLYAQKYISYNGHCDVQLNFCLVFFPNQIAEMLPSKIIILLYCKSQLIEYCNENSILNTMNDKIFFQFFRAYKQEECVYNKI